MSRVLHESESSRGYPFPFGAQNVSALRWYPFPYPVDDGGCTCSDHLSARGL